MSTLSTRNPWPADVAQRLDGICLRFEDAWRAASVCPRIEDFLNEASPSERPWLLRELVGLDADYRSRRGEAPPLSDYQRRFPELDSIDGTRDWPRTPAEREAKTPPGECIPLPGNVSVSAGMPGYELLGVLGRGAMGVVYQARQVDLGRIVALKMILAAGHADSAMRARFRVEAQAIARVQHPNIVQVFEVGEYDGLPFISLEYCAGGSLSRKLSGTPLQANEAAQLLQTLALAMHAAHQKEIIHRDLKPANVLLAADGTPKITDFGLAKMLDQAGPTQSGAMMGTPSYMPPEQADPRLGESGPLCDVYALGAMLYEFLTGRPPFKGATPLETIAQLIANEAVPPRQLNGQVPIDLETICLKCLQKAPDKRYASAEALADDLRRFQTGEPIVARRVGLWERGVKYARRKPWVLGSWVAAIAAVLFLVAGGGYYLYRQNLDLAAELLRQKELEEKRVGAAARASTAEDALAKRDWPAVVAAADGTLDLTGDEPALADLADQARRLRAAAKTILRFIDHRDEAIYHAVLAMEQGDQDAHRHAVRDAAAKALALFGLSGDGPAAIPHFGDAPLTPETQRWLTECSYELFLTWAVVLSPAETDNPAERRDRAEQALGMLDRAAQLGLTTRSEHRRRAVLLRIGGDAAGGDKAQQRAAALTPSRAVDHFLLGMEASRAGQMDRAAGHFTKVLELQPEHFWASYCLAGCYLRDRPRRLERALAPLTACIQMKPKFVWSYLVRGFVHGELDEFEAADADFDAAQKLAVDELAWYGLRVNRAAVRLRQGINHERQADLARPFLDTAVADLEEAVTLRPQQPQAYAILAEAYSRRGQPNEARRQLDKAIALAPSAKLLRTRARLHEKLDSDDDALADLAEAIRRAQAVGSLAEVGGDQLQRGRILFKMEKYPDALDAFNNALAAAPNLVVVHQLRGETLLELAAAHRLKGETHLERERIREAAVALDRYLAKGRPSALASRARGLCRAKLDRYAEAIEDFSRALEIDRLEGTAVDPETLAYRGWAYVTLDAPKLALPDFDQALELNGENRGDCLAGRGYARVLLGHWRDAVADAEAALREGPPPARTLYNAARTYAQAVAKVQRDPEWQNPLGQQRRMRYVQRALELLHRACEKTPAGERTAFWTQHVEVDLALRTITGTAAFDRMRQEFVRPVKEKS